jgi:hypothetical protein
VNTRQEDSERREEISTPFHVQLGEGVGVVTAHS